MSSVTNRTPKPRRGYALILVLLVLVVLSAAAFLVAAQIQMRIAGALDEARNVHLRNLVDSGAALGLARITEDRYGTGTFSQTLDGGSVSCTLEIVAGSRRNLRVDAEFGGEVWSYLFVVQLSTGPPRIVDQRFLSATGG